MKRYIFFMFFLIITPLANAQTLNVFPQVADGVFGDGGYYKTTFMILPGYDTSSPTITCTLVLYGLGVNLDGHGSASQWTMDDPPADRDEVRRGCDADAARRRFDSGER